MKEIAIDRKLHADITWISNFDRFCEYMEYGYYKITVESTRTASQLNFTAHFARVERDSVFASRDSPNPLQSILSSKSSFSP